jgi:hypothetical protein
VIFHEDKRRGEERRESKSIMRSNIKLLLLQESISLSKKYL